MTILSAEDIAELRESDDNTLIALYNVETMGATCLRVGDAARSGEIFETVVSELRARDIEYDVGALIG